METTNLPDLRDVDVQRSVFEAYDRSYVAMRAAIDYLSERVPLALVVEALRHGKRVSEAAK